MTKQRHPIQSTTPHTAITNNHDHRIHTAATQPIKELLKSLHTTLSGCLLYTSDAADD